MKRLLGLILIVSLFSQTVFAQNSEIPFTDHLGHDYEKAIEYLYNEGIIEGYPNYKFLPDKQINRAEFLKIIVESNYNKSDYESYANVSCFPDVNAEEWYSQYICFAKEKGIVEGYPDGNFKPGQKINLVESLKIIYEGMNLVVKNPDAVFKFRYYSPAMLSGYLPGELKGGYEEIVTRAQISEIIYRILIDDEKELENEIILNLDIHKQKYRSSCGNAALATALSKEIDVTEDETIEKMIDMGMYPNNEIVLEDENYVWDDPQKVFVGDYDGIVSINMSVLNGFGFLETPLEELAKQWAPGSEKFTGKNIGFIAQQLNEGYPVIVFANVNARDGSVLIDEPGPYTVTWKIRNEDRMLTVPMYKHNLIIEGYRGNTSNPEVFHIIDPFYGQKMEITPHELENILEGYSFSGVVIKF